MIEYQNIFTQVQVRGPVEMGVDNENNMAAERGGTPWFSRFAGWIGNAQIGPVFLVGQALLLFQQVCCGL